MDIKTRKGGRLVPFGNLAGLTTPSNLFDAAGDTMARAVHEAFLAHPTENLTASAPWSQPAERLKQQNRQFANHIPVKLSCLGLSLVEKTTPEFTFTENQIESLAHIEHRRRCLVLKARGWRHAEEKDDFAHLHNLLLGWDELPDDAKATNRKLVRHKAGIVARAELGIGRDQCTKK